MTTQDEARDALASYEQRRMNQDMAAHPAWGRPVLYSDIVGGKVVGRDDLWMITTRELLDLTMRAKA